MPQNNQPIVATNQEEANNIVDGGDIAADIAHMPMECDDEEHQNDERRQERLVVAEYRVYFERVEYSSTRVRVLVPENCVNDVDLDRVYDVGYEMWENGDYSTDDYGDVETNVDDNPPTLTRVENGFASVPAAALLRLQEGRRRMEEATRRMRASMRGIFDSVAPEEIDNKGAEFYHIRNPEERHFDEIARTEEERNMAIDS